MSQQENLSQHNASQEVVQHKRTALSRKARMLIGAAAAVDIAAFFAGVALTAQTEQENKQKAKQIVSEMSPTTATSATTVFDAAFHFNAKQDIYEIDVARLQLPVVSSKPLEESEVFEKAVEEQTNRLNDEDVPLFHDHVLPVSQNKLDALVSLGVFPLALGVAGLYMAFDSHAEATGSEQEKPLEK